MENIALRLRLLLNWFLTLEATEGDSRTSPEMKHHNRPLFTLKASIFYVASKASCANMVIEIDTETKVIYEPEKNSWS